MLTGFRAGRVGREETHVGGMFRDELAHSLSQNGTDQNVRVKDDGALCHHRLFAQTIRVGPGYSRGFAGRPLSFSSSFASSLELRCNGIDVD